MTKKPHSHPHDDAAENPAAQERPAGELEHLSYDELEAKLNETEAKMNAHWEQVLRGQAELENFRRRAERDVSSAHKYALEKIAAELLPVVDSLERGIEGSDAQQATTKGLRDGMEMTLSLLIKAMDKFGIKVVNPLEGENFNPAIHQAMSAMPDPNAKPNTILRVLQKGYSLHERLLRPALVIVAKE